MLVKEGRKDWRASGHCDTDVMHMLFITMVIVSPIASGLTATRSHDGPDIFFSCVFPRPRDAQLGLLSDWTVSVLSTVAC